MELLFVSLQYKCILLYKPVWFTYSPTNLEVFWWYFATLSS